jgi:hypothetical protein
MEVGIEAKTLLLGIHPTIPSLGQKYSIDVIFFTIFQSTIE